MAGARMEVTYGPSWLQLWFTSYSDFLAQWDRSISRPTSAWRSARASGIRICFFGCVTITMSVSVGATLHLEGPPLHGTVSVDLGPTSVTVPFGPQPRRSRLCWPTFTLKYLKGSIPRRFRLAFRSAAACCLRIRRERQSHPAARRSRGSSNGMGLSDRDAHAGAGFAFVRDDAGSPWNPNAAARFVRFPMTAETYDIDIGPMDEEQVESCARVFIDRRVGSAWQRIDAAELDARRFFLEPGSGRCRRRHAACPGRAAAIAATGADRSGDTRRRGAALDDPRHHSDREARRWPNRDRCRSRVPRPRCSPTFVSPGSRPISICQSGTICRSSNRFAPAPPC